MHAYPVRESNAHYYFKNNELLLKYEPNSVCLLAPGDIAWESDLDVLLKLAQGTNAPYSLQSVAAKYLINEKRDMQ